MHWGGRTWNRLIATALNFAGDLTGQTVLELGFRTGEMSCEFARRGARVTGVDVKEDYVREARFTAAQYRLTAQTTFKTYSGDLASVPGVYDLVFTKSVLVLTDLSVMLPAIAQKLRPDGRVIFIENGAGNRCVQIARRMLRPRKNYANVSHFTEASVDLIRQHFTLAHLEATAFPPVYLVCGHI